MRRSANALPLVTIWSGDVVTAEVPMPADDAPGRDVGELRPVTATAAARGVRCGDREIILVLVVVAHPAVGGSPRLGGGLVPLLASHDVHRAAWSNRSTRL